MRPKKKKQKRYIDGIFNYCDRWCERCEFTRRGRLYDMGKEAFPDEESRDIDNDAFWQALHGVLEQTKEMLRQSAAEQGIDLDQIEIKDNGEWERRRDAALSSELGQMGEDYAEKVSGWFEAHEALLNEYKAVLESRLQMELEGDAPEAEAVAVEDAAEVIRWY